MPSATGCDALPLRGLCDSDEPCLGYGVADETVRVQQSVVQPVVRLVRQVRTMTIATLLQIVLIVFMVHMRLLDLLVRMVA